MDLKPDEPRNSHGEFAVLVTALAAFHGRAWEGRAGQVIPGDTFSTPRLRAVELKANGLVRDAAANASVSADPAAPAAIVSPPTTAPVKSGAAKEKTR